MRQLHLLKAVSPRLPCMFFLAPALTESETALISLAPGRGQVSAAKRRKAAWIVWEWSGPRPGPECAESVRPHVGAGSWVPECPMLAQWLFWQSQMFFLSHAGQIISLHLPSVFEETPSVSSWNSPTSIAFLTDTYNLSVLHQLLTSVSCADFFLSPTKRRFCSQHSAYCSAFISQNTQSFFPCVCSYLRALASLSLSPIWTLPPGRLAEI